MNTTINEKSTELSKLLIPHRTSPIMQRVQSFVINRTGKKLTEFMANGASEEEKSNLLGELIDIIKGEQWDKLPAAAGGQQTAAPAPGPVHVPGAKIPIPAAVMPVAPKPASWAPKPDVLVNVAKLPTNAEIAALAAPAPVAEPTPAADPITAAIAALNAALIAAKTPPPPPPAPVVVAPPGLTADEVRVIIRAELAAVLRTIADVLTKPAAAASDDE